MFESDGAASELPGLVYIYCIVTLSLFLNIYFIFCVFSTSTVLQLLKQITGGTCFSEPDLFSLCSVERLLSAYYSVIHSQVHLPVTVNYSEMTVKLIGNVCLIRVRNASL